MIARIFRKAGWVAGISDGRREKLRMIVETGINWWCCISNILKILGLVDDRRRFSHFLDTLK
jgi:hypothetical protein